jgi:hypothetical protein
MLRNPPSGESDSSANTEGAHPAHSDGGFLLLCGLARQVSQNGPERKRVPMWITTGNPLGTRDAPPWNRTKNLLIKRTFSQGSPEKNLGMALPDAVPFRPVVSRQPARVS